MAQNSIDEKTKEYVSTFKKAIENMIATNEQSYSDWNWSKYLPFANLRGDTYSEEEIRRIIDSGSLEEQRKLSKHYYKKDGFYKRILLHYATLLNYYGILIPNPNLGKQLSEPFISKRYYQAVSFVDKMNLPSFLTACATKIVVEGCYYGLILTADKKGFSVVDLSSEYCRTRFKDYLGNDILEFDVRYFDTIKDEDDRKSALKTYPSIISNYYRRYHDGKVTYPWVFIPADIGICFPWLNDGAPLFLNTIPAALDYDKAVETEQQRDLEEIRKIIVQKIPYYDDGQLLFEPQEAAVMHAGTVNMLKNNPNVSVLTTYADTDAIVSKTASDVNNNTLEKMVKNIYYQSGVSGELFATTGNLALETSLRNDLALVMSMAYKFQNFVTNLVNRLFANGNISFRYMILPITRYNEKEYIDNAFKLAGGGYSLLLPMIAMGFSQNDINNIKDLENEVLNIDEKLKPLSSAWNQSAETREVGAPEKDLDDKSAKTIANEVSLDEGGSN